MPRPAHDESPSARIESSSDVARRAELKRNPPATRGRLARIWLKISAVLSFVFGCAAPPTFEEVIAGKVQLEAADHEALLELMAESGIAASELRLLRPEEQTSGPAPFVRIDEGRITALALEGLRDSGAVARLDWLQELRLAGSFSSLELHGFSRLRSLEALSSGEQLRQIRLAELPRLRTLNVHGAQLGAGLQLGHLPALASLGLTRCGLSHLPTLQLPVLEELMLGGNRLASLESLAQLSSLRRLHLEGNGIETLDTLPRLRKLRSLYLSDNPLHPETVLSPKQVPALRKIDLRRTGLRAAPLGLRQRADGTEQDTADGRPRLRVELEPELKAEIEFQRTLARLREQALPSGTRLVKRLANTGGTLRDSRGKCSWRTSSVRRARVSCSFDIASVEGTAALRLGTTDLAMPFSGGGTPRMRATLKVGEGKAALYLRHQHDHIAVARLLSELNEEQAEASRQAGDRFEGYLRVEARPGQPGTGQGEPSLLGSRVVLWIEAIGGAVRDLKLEIAPD